MRDADGARKKKIPRCPNRLSQRAERGPQMALGERADPLIAHGAVGIHEDERRHDLHTEALGELGALSRIHIVEPELDPVLVLRLKPVHDRRDLDAGGSAW